MGITSNLAASRLIQPGVIASSSERPASPYEGQMVYQKDTNSLYIYNGSSWIMLTNADAPPAMELIKTQTIGTNVASVQMTSAFSATYDSYHCIITDMLPTANQPFLQLKLGSTTSGYYWSGFYIGYSTASLTAVAKSNDPAWGWGEAGNAVASTYSFTIHNPYLAKRTFFNAVNASPIWTNVYNGYLDNTTQYTDFTVQANSGNLTGGTIRLYGYRTSI